MAQVVYARAALRDLGRLFAFLAVHDRAAARASAAAIRSAVELLAAHPYIGRVRTIDSRGRLRRRSRAAGGELWELVISYGKTGYVALYRYVPLADEVRILGIRAQRELDYRP